MTTNEEPTPFFMRALRYALALMIGTLIIVKGVPWIGVGTQDYSLALAGTIAGAAVVLISGSPSAWILELILFVVCFLYLRLPFNLDTVGAQVYVAYGLIFGWIFSSRFVKRLGKED